MSMATSAIKGSLRDVSKAGQAATRLGQQLTAGKKKIAIFYGAAHMPDFDKRLKEDFGMKRTDSVWITAWNLVESSPMD